MRLHQGFIPHMRILAEAIHGLGCCLTVLLSRDRACWFCCHRRRDHHRSTRASHVSQLSRSIGLLGPRLGGYQVLHFHHFSLSSAFPLVSCSPILPYFHDYSCGYKSGSGVGTLAVALGGSAPLTISSLTQLGSRGPLGDRLSHVPPLRGNLSSPDYRLHFQWRGLLNAPASSPLDDFSYV